MNLQDKLELINNLPAMNENEKRLGMELLNAMVKRQQLCAAMDVPFEVQEDLKSAVKAFMHVFNAPQQENKRNRMTAKESEELDKLVYAMCLVVSKNHTRYFLFSEVIDGLLENPEHRRKYKESSVRNALQKLLRDGKIEGRTFLEGMPGNPRQYELVK